MKVVDLDELTDEEAESYNAAVQQFRGVSEQQFFQSVALRDDKGRLAEVRFYWSSEKPRIIAVATIEADGLPALKVSG